jgi:hypothetical protein
MKPYKIVAALIVWLLLMYTFASYKTMSSASSISRKTASLKPTYERLPKTRKLAPPFLVTIHGEDRSDLDFGERFVLHANIETIKLLGPLHFQWILPEGVIAIPGSTLQGQIEPTPRNESHLIITLENHSLENQSVQLQVWSEERRMTQSAHYNTLFQKKINEDRKELSDKQDDYIQQVLGDKKTYD